MKTEIIQQANENTEFEGRNGSDDNSWPDIVPFEAGSIAQPDYPLDALGKIASSAANRIMEVVECPKAMAGASVFGAINTCCQPHWDLEIDGRIQPISAHQMEVGESGIRKSATDEQSHKCIKEEQKKKREQYKLDYAKYIIELDAYDAERRLILNDKKIKTQQDRQTALEKLIKPDRTINPILLVSDPTIQGIEKNWQNAGLPATALNTTEGGRLLGGHAMKEENMIHTAASFSLYYDGAPVDRIRGADGADVIYGKRLSINIMLQPRLAKKLYGNEELRDQGWLSRVAPTLCEGKQKDYKEVDLSKDPAMISFWDRCKELLDKALPIQGGKRNNE
jgi:hypothetical protein